MNCHTFEIFTWMCPILNKKKHFRWIVTLKFETMFSTVCPAYVWSGIFVCLSCSSLKSHFPCWFGSMEWNELFLLPVGDVLFVNNAKTIIDIFILYFGVTETFLFFKKWLLSLCLLCFIIFFFFLNSIHCLKNYFNFLDHILLLVTTNAAPNLYFKPIISFTKLFLFIKSFH